jgi:aspartyl-tRNA(Asn)/glutamyl-tRNA(Gln) amidotransferase subunit C
MVEIEVNEELVKKVAKNARINLTDKELKKFTPELKEIIIDSFNKIDSIEVEEEASFQPISQKNKFREDKVKESLSVEEALKNVDVKLRELDYIKGPKVVDKQK